MDMNTERIIESHVDELLQDYPDITGMAESIRAAARFLVDRCKTGAKILTCGNGGSAADADHIVGELVKSFLRKRPIDSDLKTALTAVDPQLGEMMADKLQKGIPAFSLTQNNALATAFSNDVDPRLVFAQQVHVLANPGDVLWGISTSGNSVNVVAAAVTAKACGLYTIGMTGLAGGMLSRFCDVCLRVPETETYRIQERHLPIYHRLCMIIEDVLFL